jgi:riboflavin biosynthesis pyrimidine reductase
LSANDPIRRFEVLFDSAEPNAIDHPGYAPYGNLGFPPASQDRPWIYTNFVQSLDGITTLLGKHASGGEISPSADDRWLMDLLRAHADGLLMGMNTLREEQRQRGPGSRGIVFQVVDPTLRDLRQKLGKGRERNIFVTSAADLDLSGHKVFDGDLVDAAILTSPAGAERLRAQGERPHLAIVSAGEKEHFDLPRAIAKLRDELGIQHLLCEGGPTLYGSLARADLVDEKFMTIAPVEVGQLVPPEQERLPAEQKTPVLLRPTVFGGAGFTREQLTHWTWLSCRKAGDHQFNRYRRNRIRG